MVVLNLEYEGHSLTLEFKNSSFFTKTEIVAGKTVYQKLFEYMIDGRLVTATQLERVTTRHNFQKRVSDTIILNAMRKIEAALKNSPDSKLKKMRFIKAKRGGATSVTSRMSSRSRYTRAQHRIIHFAIEGKLETGSCSLTELREHCLRTLNERGLGENVLLSANSLNRAVDKIQEKRRQQGQPPLSKLIILKPERQKKKKQK